MTDCSLCIFPDQVLVGGSEQNRQSDCFSPALVLSKFYLGLQKRKAFKEQIKDKMALKHPSLPFFFLHGLGERLSKSNS